MTVGGLCTTVTFWDLIVFNSGSLGFNCINIDSWSFMYNSDSLGFNFAVENFCNIFIFTKFLEPHSAYFAGCSFGCSAVDCVQLTIFLTNSVNSYEFCDGEKKN